MRTPALIVGGGPAGSAAALLLARAGQPHLLIERAQPPGDALCGGFLSWRTLATLERLGVEGLALNRETITELRLFAGTTASRAALPHPARAVSRHRLDTLLMQAARGAGAAVEVATARAVEDNAVRLDDGATIAADTLFLATGKHELRGLARPVVRARDPALGLRVRLGPAPALTRLVGGAIELHLFDRGYAGIALQEDGTANLCMAVHRSRLAEAGSPERLLTLLGSEQPRLAERLAFLAPAAAIDAVANVPYGWRAHDGVAGLFRLGDQAAVIPSLAGEGIGIAVASGVRAAAAYLAHGPGGAAGYQRALAAALTLPFATAGLVRGAAERPATARLLAQGARLPGLAGLVARLTRIKESPVDLAAPATQISPSWTM